MRTRIKKSIAAFWFVICLCFAFPSGVFAQPLASLPNALPGKTGPLHTLAGTPSLPRGYKVAATQAAANGPGLELMATPWFGYFYSHNFIQGHVTNVDPAKFQDYKIGVVVGREGLGYYSKPTCLEVLSQVDHQGNFSVLAHSGGRDDIADHIIVFLVPASTQIFCHSSGGDYIGDYESASVARIDIERDDPFAQELSFSGIPFLVRDSQTPVDPGRTTFRPDNAWVDAAGLLHLRTRTINRQRTGAEIISKQAFGRGRYIVEVVTSASSIPASTVFGAYTWGNDSSNAHREGDIVELSRFGTQSTTAGAGIQPVIAPNYQFFNQPDGCSRHEMIWGTATVRFVSYDCSGKLIHDFTYSGVQPVKMDEKFRVNLWSLVGSSDPDAEIIVKSVRFEPEPRSSVTHVASTHYLNEHGFASGTIVSAFAFGSLATVTQGAPSQPLPTTLGGTTVLVRDQTGNQKLAKLLFVSPTQVNYVVPEGLALGVADVTITNAKSEQFVGTIRLNRVSPGIFTADASGRQGSIPAAFLQRVKPDGTSVYEPLFRIVGGQVVAVPIDTNSVQDKLYLLLYATGVRQRQSLGTVGALIGDTDMSVEYAGPQTQFAGLDQVNVRIPAFFDKHGSQPVRLVVDGQVSNIVNILFQ